MKRFIIITLAFMLTISITSCRGDKKESGFTGTDHSEKPTDTSVLTTREQVGTSASDLKPDFNVTPQPTNGRAAHDAELERILVGLWHNSPVVGSGFSERLLLEKEYSFVWFASQMDGMQRVRARSGYWKVTGGKLELYATEEIRWEGGRVVPAFASWGTDEVIEDARLVSETLLEPLLLIYDISEITIDKEVLDKRTVTIDGEVYWELYYPADRDEIYNEYEEFKTNNGYEMFSGHYNHGVLKTFDTPLSPELAERGTLCCFNGCDYPWSHYTWADYEDGSGGYCLMILIDAETPDGGAIDALYLPGYGLPAIGRNRYNIYIEWTNPANQEETIELMFEEQSGKMVIFANALKGVMRSRNQSDTVEMPVSVYKDDSGRDRYYVPLYAILNEIGGGVIVDAFSTGETYIYSGAHTQSYTGFWETSDRSGERADAVIGGITQSISSYWNGLELRPDGTFTESYRIFQDEGNWVLTEITGRYVFWGRTLVMLYETESEWRGVDYAALVPVRMDTPVEPYIFGRYVVQWDADYLDVSGKYPLYANLTEYGDSAPRPGKAPQTDNTVFQAGRRT